MIEKLQLKMIPEELQFYYLSLHNKINKICNELGNFTPVSEDQNPWIRDQLCEYSKLFVEIESINNKIKKNCLQKY